MIFQIWVRRDEARPTFPVATTSHITAVPPSQADAALTVFGRGCGTLRTVFEDKANTTQKFIAATPEILAALAAIDLAPFFTQVAYTEALSTAEINYAISHWLATGEQLAPGFLRDSTIEP